MAKGIYIGDNNVARKVKKMYIGVDDKARKVKKIYIGDENNKARLAWSSGLGLGIKPGASFTFDYQYSSDIGMFDRGWAKLNDHYFVLVERQNTYDPCLKLFRYTDSIIEHIQTINIGDTRTYGSNTMTQVYYDDESSIIYVIFQGSYIRRILFTGSSIQYLSSTTGSNYFGVPKPSSGNTINNYDNMFFYKGTFAVWSNMDETSSTPTTPILYKKAISSDGQIAHNKIYPSLGLQSNPNGHAIGAIPIDEKTFLMYFVYNRSGMGLGIYIKFFKLEFLDTASSNIALKDTVVTPLREYTLTTLAYEKSDITLTLLDNKITGIYTYRNNSTGIRLSQGVSIPFTKSTFGLGEMTLSPLNYDLFADTYPYNLYPLGSRKIDDNLACVTTNTRSVDASSNSNIALRYENRNGSVFLGQKITLPMAGWYTIINLTPEVNLYAYMSSGSTVTFQFLK